MLSVLLLGHVEPANRRVPPRTPEDRLNTLNRFLRQWADTEIVHKAGKNARPNRVISIMDSKVFGSKFFDHKSNSTQIDWEDSLFIDRFRHR